MAGDAPYLYDGFPIKSYRLHNKTDTELYLLWNCTKYSPTRKCDNCNRVWKNNSITKNHSVCQTMANGTSMNFRWN